MWKIFLEKGITCSTYHLQLVFIFVCRLRLKIYIIQGLYFMVDLEIIGDTYNSQQLECVLAILVDICIFFDKWYLI